MAIKSLGPVPALLLMTMDMPIDKITHPKIIPKIRHGKVESALIKSPKSYVKKSMIGPPQKAHKIVPGFTYPLVVRSITTNKIHKTMT